jgi:uncharacterized SAM-binding protein YcdF (DUF218 family)
MKAGILFLLFILLLGGVFFTGPYFLNLAGDYLVINNPEIKKAEVAVVLSGEEGERIDYAIELFKKGLVKYLLLSGNTPGYTVEEMEERAVPAGVPRERIILEPDSRSTYENAIFSKKIIKKYNFKNVVVVSSSYHSRRVEWVFKKVFRDVKIKLQICYCPLSWFKKDHWWRKANHRVILKREYERLFWYYLYYGFLGRSK